MKLIKYSLIAAVGVFLLPAPPPDSFAVMQGGSRINLETGEVLSAAASTYSDVSGFCQRQPAVCNTAGQALSAFEVRAKYNFKRLYEWSQSSGQPASGQPASLNRAPSRTPSLSLSVRPQAQLQSQLQAQQYDSIITASIKVSQGNRLGSMILAESKKPSINTLELEDLLPQWRGPGRTSTG